MMTRDAKTRLLEIADTLRRLRGEIEQHNPSADDRLTAAAGQLGHTAALLCEVAPATPPGAGRIERFGR